MSDYLRWGGVAIIFLCAFLFGKEYSARADRGVLEYRGFTALLLHIEGEISRAMSFAEGLWKGFADERLEECGFLPLLKKGKTPSAAFEECKNKLVMPKEAKEKLSELFSAFGRNYRESELKRLTKVRGELEADLSAYAEEVEKNKKVINALLLGVAASAAIIMI